MLSFECCVEWQYRKRLGGQPVILALFRCSSAVAGERWSTLPEAWRWGRWARDGRWKGISRGVQKTVVPSLDGWIGRTWFVFQKQLPLWSSMSLRRCRVVDWTGDCSKSSRDKTSDCTRTHCRCHHLLDFGEAESTFTGEFHRSNDGVNRRKSRAVGLMVILLPAMWGEAVHFNALHWSINAAETLHSDLRSPCFLPVIQGNLKLCSLVRAVYVSSSRTSY